MPAIATYSFSDKTILITGGAGEIGMATARRFAKNGAGVVLLDIDRDKLSEAVGELNQYGTPVYSFCCDVTRSEAVAKAFTSALEQLNRIDYVFNNAGYQGVFAQTDQYPDDDFRKVIEINIVGVFNVLKIASQCLQQQGGGAIVNMASYAGVVGPPNMLAYAASKFAVVGMTQTAAKDLAPNNIRVNALSPSLIGPGMMWTRQTELQAQVGSQYFSVDPKIVEQQMIDSVPMRRLGRLEEVANGVAFLTERGAEVSSAYPIEVLMSDEASYITGFNLEVTGGQ